MTNDNDPGGSEVARRLGRIWGDGAERVIASGVCEGDVARSLVAVGLELWTRTEGPTAVAQHLAGIADNLQDVAAEIEDPLAGPMN